jgi:hypothetical protein
VLDEPSVEMIEKFDPPAHKAASASVTDVDLLREMRRSGRPLIMSTGMSTLEEIDLAVAAVGRQDLCIAHTTSSYPCPVEDLNLRMMHTLAARYRECPIGYSGHETGLSPTWAAVALGATFVERHITLDRAMWGTDQAASVEVSGLVRLVSQHPRPRARARRRRQARHPGGAGGGQEAAPPSRRPHGVVERPDVLRDPLPDHHRRRRARHDRARAALPVHAGQKLFRDGFWTDFVGYSLIQSYFCGLIIAQFIRWIDSGTGLSRLHLVTDWPIYAQVGFFLITHDLYIYCFHRCSTAPSCCGASTRRTTRRRTSTGSRDRGRTRSRSSSTRPSSSRPSSCSARRPRWR